LRLRLITGVKSVETRLFYGQLLFCFVTSQFWFLLVNSVYNTDGSRHITLTY